MARIFSWQALACACLIHTGCSDSDRSEPSNTDSASSRSSDAGGPPLDSATPAAREPVDQTAPSGANGLAFDADGMIWLTDLFGQQLLRLDPTTGEILARFTPELAGPDDVAIDTQGRVFWTDWSGGHVGRLDPKTMHNEFVATLPVGANSIAFSEDGRLFVGMVILNRGLYELDPEGVREPRLINGVINVNAFDIGPDGHLWGPTADGIVKLDLESGEVIETVAKGPYASVRYDERSGALYALTNGGATKVPALHKISVEDFGVSDFYAPQLRAIDNFVFGPAGDIFVTGYDVPKLEKIEPDGSSGVVVEIGASSEH